MTEQQRFTCDWLWNQLVVLSDGKVVCGCADPYGERPLGHLDKQSLHEIWNAPHVQKIRRQLNDGYAPFCKPCGLKTMVDEDYEIPQRPEHVETLPRIFLEPAVGCNISCFEAVCNQTSKIVQTRSQRLMDWDDFKRIVDSVGNELVRLDFFNYGESFVHPKSVEMMEYIKATYPDVFLYISTNGLLLTDEKMARLVEAGVDEITFSVDGPDQATYEKYRVKGDFEKVFGIMRRFVEIREAAGAQLPYLNWRYIIFKWNDSDEKMDRTRQLAADIGIDKLVWEITNHPPVAASEKYQPGTPAWREIYNEIWDTSQTCNAIDRRRLLADIGFDGDGSWTGQSSQATTVRVRVHNTGGALWRSAAHGWRRTIRLGAQLHDGDRNLIDRDYARAFLPRDVAGNESVDIDIELPALAAPGEYTLKFDMACEGIDWLESGGSPVSWGALSVSPSAEATNGGAHVNEVSLGSEVTPVGRLLNGARTLGRRLTGR